MSSQPFYRWPTAGRKIVHPIVCNLFYLAVWLFLIVGIPFLIFLITGPES